MQIAVLSHRMPMVSIRGNGGASFGALVANRLLVRCGLCEVWPTRFRAWLDCFPLPDVIGNIEVAKIDTIGW
jgi:hypothetical protein